MRGTDWTPEGLRSFVDKIAEHHDAGRLPFALHLAGGNEEQLIDIFSNINEGDYVLSTHRNMYHALLHGLPPEEVEDKILNGRSMFMFDRERNFYVSAIIGGPVAIAVGIAWALKRKGFGLDICASYPSILSGITSEVIRRRGSVCMLDETREMTRDTKSWRAAVAKQLGVTIPIVKKGVQALMFGMNSKKWRRGQGIPDNIRSPSLDRLEKEIKEARMLITDDEIKAGRASPGDKPARILSRTVERVEEEIIAELISHLKEQGWVTSSLIHDEIVVQHSNRFLNPNEELQSLCHNSKLGFRAFEDSRGWPPGSLRVDVQRL